MQRSWVETIPGVPFAADRVWRDTPIDSLQALLFVLRLEREVGRPIPFDLLTPDTTPRRLAATLAGAESGSAGVAARHILLVPGIFGDEPRLAEFRRFAGPELSFHTLPLPDLDAPLDLLTSVGGTADWIINTQIPADGVWRTMPVVGYSFGGLVALEIAARSGARAPLLCLLDTWLSYGGGADPEPSQPSQPSQEERSLHDYAAKLKRLGGRREERRVFVFKRVMRLLLRLSAYRLARLLYNACKEQLPIVEQVHMRRLLLGGIRLRAVKRWAPRRYDGPTLLLASRDMPLLHPAEAWRDVCPNLEVVEVDGDHFSVLDARCAHLLSEHIRAAAG